MREDLLLQELVDSNGGSECVPVLVRGKFKQRDHKITIVAMLTWFSERHHVTGASLGISKIKIIYEAIAKRAATIVLLLRMKVIMEQMCYLATTWPASIRLAATV